MTTELRQVQNHRWPSGGDQPIALLQTSAEDLALRHGLLLEKWEEDGLGPACGFACMLPSGRVVLIYDLEHMNRSVGIASNVSADLGDIANVGPAVIVAEVLSTFRVTRSEVLWEAPGEQRAK